MRYQDGNFAVIDTHMGDNIGQMFFIDGRIWITTVYGALRSRAVP